MRLQLGRILFCFIWTSAVLIFGLNITAVSAQGLSGEELVQLLIRTDNNTLPNQFESFLTIKDYKPGKTPRVYNAHIYRKEDKMIIFLTSPVSQKGEAVIRNGDDMWMYLPKSEKTLRVGAKDNSLGGEASNADLMRVDLAKDYDGTYLGMETIDNINCYKLELKAKRRTVAYDKVICWISGDHELPVKREYYTLSGKWNRTISYSEVKLLGGRERPSLIRIENLENKGCISEIVTDDLNPDVTLNDTIFNPLYVKQLNQ